MSGLRAIASVRQYGLTMVELVISIAVIAAGVGGTLLAINQVVRSSADPMVVQQAVAIAEAYLAEATSKAFSEDAVNGVAETYGPLGTNPGEPDRTLFDDVDDYNGLVNAGVVDQNNQAVAGLGTYNVTVTVTYAALGNIAAAPGNAKLVQVNVTGPGGAAVVLSGYRTNY